MINVKGLDHGYYNTKDNELRIFRSAYQFKLGDGYYNFVAKLPNPLNPKHVL
jgi:hypothetical protein